MSYLISDEMNCARASDDSHCKCTPNTFKDSFIADGFIKGHSLVCIVTVRNISEIFEKVYYVL